MQFVTVAGDGLVLVWDTRCGIVSERVFHFWCVCMHACADVLHVYERNAGKGIMGFSNNIPINQTITG